ncbi:hypothetical protein ACHHYP_11255 [Achlya hypogyna]|uniref:Uncharacterized protein n=1 Tax=Achlya hypogyna TaxID=1202772 RepID=A0A1V9YJI3_ACHHY|nr:hypothetical protein ACHHYP_11255 [Achlya hypogyna]
MAKGYNQYGRPWLVYDEPKGAIFCTTCKLAKLTSIFTQGSYVGGLNKVLKVQAVKDHGATFDAATQTQTNNVTATDLGVTEMPIQEWSMHAMRCAYFLAAHNLPPRLMASLTCLVHDTIKTYVGERSFATLPGLCRSYANNQAAMELIGFCATEILASSVAAIAEA